MPTRSILLSVYILQGCLDGKKQEKNGNEQAKKYTRKAKRTPERQKGKISGFCNVGQKKILYGGAKTKVNSKEKGLYAK